MSILVRKSLPAMHQIANLVLMETMNTESAARCGRCNSPAPIFPGGRIAPCPMGCDAEFFASLSDDEKTAVSVPTADSAEIDNRLLAAVVQYTATELSALKFSVKRALDMKGTARGEMHLEQAWREVNQLCRRLGVR